MKISFDQAMILLAGLSMGCERSKPEILAESPAQSAAAVSAVPEATQRGTEPPPSKAAPAASSVGVKEVTRAAKPGSSAPASSAGGKEKACAPGGCAPGKCG